MSNTTITNSDMDTLNNEEAIVTNPITAAEMDEIIEQVDNEIAEEEKMEGLAEFEKACKKVRKAVVVERLYEAEQALGKAEDTITTLKVENKALSKEVAALKAAPKSKPDITREQLLGYLVGRLKIRMVSKLWQHVQLVPVVNDEGKKWVEVSFNKEFYLSNRDECIQFLGTLRGITTKRDMKSASGNGHIKVYFN